jgi:P4 family phage/plasmid primase-like protien
MLDGNENLLNTPTATYDLKKGVDSAKEHDPKDFITKQTTVDPSDKNADMWLEALKMFFCEDMELIDYVQRIVGLAAIGKVFQEALIISFGEGSNGKSTFWNSIASVFGTYSGTLSADVLTVACRRNTKPELAEAKGKRLMIAAEMQEGMRLNTSIVKQLCSTDKIQAEKKYKDPFNFQPTHSVVLYTNHLPKVGAIDNGTWRRIIVLPFNAKIEGKSDIKNYSDYLVKNAGGAILAWIIEGARRVIAGDHKIVPPRKVAEAIAKYRENNNWLGNFLEECCEVGEDFYEKSGDIYNEYRSYCMQNGEFVRSTSEFYASLEQEGFSKKRTPQGRCVLGLKLKAEFL